MSSLSNASQPNWQSVRARAAYGLDALTSLADLCPGHLQESAVFLLVARVCLPDWLDDDDRLRPPLELNHYMSSYAIAQSLNRPFETIRRHVSWLVEQDFLCVEDRRITLSSNSRWRDIIGFLNRRHDAFQTFMDRIADADDMLPLSNHSTASPIIFAHVLGTALDLDLVPFEFNPSLHDNLERTAMYAGFAHLGTRHIMDDAALSRRYRYENTPDHERVGSSILKVARLVGIPYTTARRQTLVLKEAGLLSRDADGLWTVKVSDLMQEELNRASAQYFLYLRGKVERLIRLGFRQKGR